MYKYGEGVPQDPAEALRWYRMAAELGNADAQFNLAVAYGDTAGDPQSSALAADWFHRAGLSYLEKGEREAAFVCAQRIGNLRNTLNKVRGVELMNTIDGWGRE
jgi:TPR repeat protein